MQSDSPITILVCALGGEGGGVLSEWLYDAARRAGYPAQATSIPGVAQRTGATTYYVEVHPQPASALAGRMPVFSLNPVPGAIDLLVSSELLETLRQVSNGLSSAQRTLVISSTARALTVAEKVQATDGRVDEAALVATLHRHAQGTELLDFAALARQAGTAISAVLFGAVAASGVLPFGRGVCEETIRASGKGVDASLRGFALAFDAVQARREQRAVAEAAVAAALEAAVDAAAQASAAPSVAHAAPARRAGIGAVAGDAASAKSAAGTTRQVEQIQGEHLRALARQRLCDYQDSRYAALYDERLARIDAAERDVDALRWHGGAIGEEMARWLALWMAFDDIVRVAALKLAHGRVGRVRREVAAQPDEIVKVYDHFKPGVPEFAALLPAGMAARLQAWDRRRVAAGRDPWALPLKIGTHTVLGALALRGVAALKGQRRRGSRFALEQSLIERWLAAVERGTREHWALGHELARCGRLIKGYGSTNERGKENLLHIIDHLAAGAEPAAQRAQAVRAAREAALADDAGHALDQTLLAHGAPPRPAREQTIRWYKRRPAAAPQP
jgi:indolepyruvate ferredoxin oxidoreductase, beta subunit